MAGAFITIGACISAATTNQVIAFVGSFLICLLFNVSGFSLVTDYLGRILPVIVMDVIRNFSFLTNFDVIVKGLIDFKALIYFGSLILTWTLVNVIVLETNKAND